MGIRQGNLHHLSCCEPAGRRESFRQLVGTTPSSCREGGDARAVRPESNARQRQERAASSKVDLFLTTTLALLAWLPYTKGWSTNPTRRSEPTRSPKGCKTARI